MMRGVNELLLITRGDNMKKSIAAGLALAAVFAAMGEVHAYVNFIPGASLETPGASIVCFRPRNNALRTAGAAGLAPNA
jgi:hypothetical protein